MKSSFLTENKTIDYKNWVLWSHQQLKTTSLGFRQEIQRMQKISTGFIAKENQEWRRLELLIILIPKIHTSKICTWDQS